MSLDFKLVTLTLTFITRFRSSFLSYASISVHQPPFPVRNDEQDSVCTPQPLAYIMLFIPYFTIKSRAAKSITSAILLGDNFTRRDELDRRVPELGR